MVNQTGRSDWQRCVDFHGHECGGLTIGYKAAQYAIKLLELTFSDDEQVVCIAENDSCSVDAIQVLLGCSMGKGNLLFHITGKQAFSFYNRTSGRSVRLLLRPRPDSMSREESFAYYQSKEPEALFLVGETRIPLPLRAQVTGSRLCDGCGEETGEGWSMLQNGRWLCPDCRSQYDRFRV